MSGSIDYDTNYLLYMNFVIFRLLVPAVLYPAPAFSLHKKFLPISRTSSFEVGVFFMVRSHASHA